MGTIGVLALSGVFAALWLASAALFHKSAGQSIMPGDGSRKEKGTMD